MINQLTNTTQNKIDSDILYTLDLPLDLLNRLETMHMFNNSNLPMDERYLLGKSGFRPPASELLYDAIVALLLGKNILLKGPTGAGKTKLAEFLSFLFYRPLHSVNCSIDLDAEALLGFKTLVHEQAGPMIDFVDGPILKAMKKGQFLYIDEINMARPETLPILNGVLDHRHTITNPFTGEVVTAKQEFGVIAAINVGYVGTVPLNEALKNRFVVIDVPYLQGKSLKQLLQNQSLLQDQTVLDRFVQLSADVLGLIRMGQLAEESASIRALLDACDLACYMPPLRAIERAIIDKLEDEREQAAIRNLAETLF